MKAIQLYAETPEAAVEREPALVANPNCQQCGLCDEASSVCMRAAGEPGGVLLVGDYPGAVEDKRGVPFTGKTGRFLQRYAATIWAGPIAVDNAVRCYPKRGAGAVGKAEVEACRGYLAHTVRLVKPQRIVAMGGKAIQGVLGRSVPLMSVRRGYGWLYNRNINDSDDPIPVFELFNPVHALRNKFMRKMFEADLRWALTCEIPQPPPWEEDCYVIENRIDSEIACNILRSAEWFAYDCEAVGIQYKKDYVVISLAACARGSSTVYVWDRTALYTPGIFEPLGALLRDPNVGKTGQNLKYDAHAVDCAFGVELQNYKGDARLQRRLLAADVDASLDVLAELVGLGGIKEEAQKALKKAQTGLTAARKRFREDPEGERLVIDNPILLSACINADEKPKTYTYGLIDNTVMLRYNARDALTTARACELTEGRLEKEPVVNRVWTEIVSKANYSIKTVERWGIPTRELNVKRYQSHLDRKMQVIKTRFDKYEGLNLNSPKSVGNLLYKQLGLHPPKTTDTGESSTDHETLEALRGQHAVVDDLLEWRRLGKLFGFAKGIERHICPDGRIHPSFKIDGTRTGRISCTEPNLQNISRPKDEDAKFARDLFVAEAGWELLEADYGQLELRVGTMLSQDPEMLKIWLEGVDYHQRTAELVSEIAWGIPSSQVTKEHRSIAKCFHPETEVLTRCGWKKIVDLLPNEEVMQAIPTKDRDIVLEWVVPNEVFTKKHPSNTLINFKSEGINLRVTPDHRMLTWTAKGYARDVLAQDFTHSTQYFSNAGRLEGVKCCDEILLRLAVALQADGHITPRGAVRFGFTKLRKIIRLEKLLKDAGLKYSCSDINIGGKDGKTFYISAKNSASFCELLGENKIFPWWWLNFTHDLREIIVQEAMYWDGYRGTKCRMFSFTSKFEQNVDVLQAIASSIGRKTRKTIKINKFGRSYFYLSVKQQSYTKIECVKAVQEIFTDEVVCLSVPSTYVLVRAGGVPVVTGQTINFGSIYGMTASTLAKRLGCSGQEATKIMTAILGKFKVFDKWCKDQVELARRTGFVWTWWAGERARRRPLFDILSQDSKRKSNAENAAKNTCIQGTASDFCLASITELVPWLINSKLPAELVLTVHDSIMFHVRSDVVEEVAHNAQRIMTQWESAGVPLVVDMKRGESWGSLEDYKLAV